MVEYTSCTIIEGVLNPKHYLDIIIGRKESDPWMPGHYKGYYTLMSGKRIHMTIEGNIGKYCKRYRGNETLISTSYTRDSIFPG